VVVEGRGSRPRPPIACCAASIVYTLRVHRRLSNVELLHSNSYSDEGRGKFPFVKPFVRVGADAVALVSRLPMKTSS
jgi:hypothetical protein